MASPTSYYSSIPPALMGPRLVDVSSLSLSHSRRSHRFGLSIQKVGAVRRSSNSERIVCLRDTKASVVTSKSWDNLILYSSTPVLVEFYASWCGPCNMVHRVIDEIASDYSGKLKCFVLDAECNPQITENYDVKAVPVVLLFKNGEKRESVVGTMPKEFYVAAIDRVLASK